ncbi:MAG: hypothetical protein PUK75_08310 [bacterium]|nr:hypothetical protein [bacterium]MDY4101057.1 hypothetical protein [Lachnospiraceae bacterium]
MAQSFSESLGTELSDPSSDLSKYLSTQIQSKKWTSKNPIRVEGADAETPESPVGVKELVLNLDDGGNLGPYHLTVTLTYTQNISDSEDIKTPDVDDSDNSGSSDQETQEPSGGTETSGETETPSVPETSDESESLQESQVTEEVLLLGEAATLSESEEPKTPIILTYSIHAAIKCVRGDATDRDAQYYVVETTYPNAITITIPEGSEDE